jgi:hypothetical protein
MSSLNNIKKYLEKLSSSNQEKFLRLLIKNNIPFSENKNGSFINISELNSHQINIINQFISLLELEEHSFNEVEKTKQLLRNLINHNTETDNSQQYDLNILS